MTVSIDLLKPQEFRRQGAVSGAFIVRVSVSSVVAFALVFGLLGLMRFRIARQDLIYCRDTWKMREPLYNQILSMKQDLATMKKLQQELNGWNASRINWGDPLLEIQRIVPAAMQLRQLNLRGELDFKQGGSGGEGEPASPPQPVRRFFLLIEGKATGDRAETMVLQFVRALGEASTFKTFLESKKLQSLQRDASSAQTGGGQGDRAFIVEAITARRLMVPKEPAPGKKEGGRPGSAGEDPPAAAPEGTGP